MISVGVLQILLRAGLAEGNKNQNLHGGAVLGPKGSRCSTEDILKATQSSCLQNS